MNDVVKFNNEEILEEFSSTKKLVMALMETKHYASMGAEGVFAILQKAKSLNIHPLEALNGGIHYVQGKTEVSAQMMNSLIRKAGHSITKDEKSDDTVCILHGKRADTGDTWTEFFSLEDARRAGIGNKDVWRKFPRSMLFARALSLLARQLFPDVIQNCYVEGEISGELELDTEIKIIKPEENKNGDN